MTSSIKFLIAVLVFLMAFADKGKAQIEVIANYVYSGDSISGFDEQAASAAALANSCFGREYKVFLYRAKREYIKQKYNIKTVIPVTTTLFQNPVSRPPATPGGACDNEDFELATSNIAAPGAVQGWSLQSGTTANNCQPPTLNATNLYTVYTSAVIDSKIPGQITSYFNSGITVPAGNCFIRLNDASAGAKAVKMSKSFIPTSNSALF